MANIIYMGVEGDNQGLISAKCSTADSIGNKYQAGHEDECLIYELIGHISRQQHSIYHPIEVRKPIDKATPLIAHSLSTNEKIKVFFNCYRTAVTGGLELFFKVKLTGATISDVRFHFPNSLTNNDVQPQERISIKYESITWEHVMSGTSSYSIWEDRVY